MVSFSRNLLKNIRYNIPYNYHYSFNYNSPIRNRETRVRFNSTTPTYHQSTSKNQSDDGLFTMIIFGGVAVYGFFSVLSIFTNMKVGVEINKEENDKNRNKLSELEKELLTLKYNTVRKEEFTKAEIEISNIRTVLRQHK